MPAAVIFDMDGLIFDTEALYQEAFRRASAAGGHSLPLEVIQRTIGLTWVQSAAMLTNQLNGLKSLDSECAESLGSHRGILSLDGIRSISDGAASSLSRHHGRLLLGRLTSMSDSAARSLAASKGGLALEGLRRLSKTCAAALASHRGDLDLGNQARPLSTIG